MTEHPSNPNVEELESLFVNNPDLDQLDAYLNRFNPIRIMRMEGMELRHSNILAWLLDPLESHGLGDRFLKAFLSEALRGESSKGSPTALDITQADIQDIEVRREWLHIDIFLLSRRNNWAFIIENKFHASQSKGQLPKYIEKARAAFEAEEGELNIRGIFLTLHDEEPEDLSYATIGYDAICDLLGRTMQAEGQSLGREVRVFLAHYIEIIKEAAGMSEEQKKLEQLARSLYRQHKKVLDFISEYGASTNFSMALDDAFGAGWEGKEVLEVGKQSIIYCWSSGDKFSFLPSGWYEALGKDDYNWPGCEKWWSGYPLICWIQIFIGNKGTEGTVRLFASVGPLNNFEARKTLIEAIKDIGAQKNFEFGFQKKATQEGTKYSTFLKNNTVKIKDVQDIDQISEAVSLLVSRFKPVFSALVPVLEPLTEYGER
ncbi:PD-(D/E)XK nuclease family protein [Thalassospira lucentensis]|uniref:PDDEXK-like family protein n=1 Tax=Thalassospira lucentensis TaxID=168935 RepID=UPI00142E1EC5|nr:PD-(D/E)XK nuclease family protein [Thalassospira lucentensis]NIZ01925.1 PD-(D/E)XK nuclease family protein [Thalassospira lucentensis]